jgi:hypothetical protein
MESVMIRAIDGANTHLSTSMRHHGALSKKVAFIFYFNLYHIGLPKESAEKNTLMLIQISFRE